MPYFWLGKVSDLDQIFAEHDLDPSKHEMQKRLAHTITSIAHGKELASAAEKISDMLFYSKPLSLSIRDSGSVLGHYRLRKYMPASSQTSILSFLTTVFPEYSKSKHGTKSKPYPFFRPIKKLHQICCAQDKPH